MSNEDAQIIEQQKLNDRAIAAVFGVPPMLIGIADTAHAKTAEALMAEWLAAGLGWLINHIEVAIDQFIGLDGVPRGARMDRIRYPHAVALGVQGTH